MSVPTHSETYVQLMEHITKAQEASAMLGHLVRADASNRKNHAVADGWIAVSEMFKRIGYQVTQLAQNRLN